MLTRIELENFKAVGERVRVELKPITLLFGANSSGKSTILQALHYAYELFVRGNANVSSTTRGGETVNLGGFRSFVHGQSTGTAARIRLDFKIDGDLLDQLEAFSGLDEDMYPEGEAGFDAFDELRVPFSKFARGGPGPGQKLNPRSGGQAIFGAGGRVRIPAEPYSSFLRALTTDVSRESRHASVEATVRWSAMRGTAVVERYRVRLNRKPLATIEASSDGKNARLTKLNLKHPLFSGEQYVAEGEDPFFTLGEVIGGDILFSERGGIPVGGTLGAMPVRPSAMWFQAPGFIEPAHWLEFSRLLRLLLAGPLEVLREMLEGFRYLGPLRCIPPRSYEALSIPDESRWANGMAAWEWLRVDGALRSATSEWLSDPERLNTGYRLRLRDLAPLGVVVDAMKERSQRGARRGGKVRSKTADVDQELVDAIRKQVAASPGVVRSELVLRPVEGSHAETLNLHPHDVGVGISQVVPVVAAALANSVTTLDGSTARTSLVMIEQPELHIHPAMQVALGDLFISACKSRQFLIETHSEHLVLRLLRRIRETATSGVSKGPDKAKVYPKDIAVYFLEVPGGGQLALTPLRVDELGEFIDAWPRGFFQERLEEVF